MKADHTAKQLFLLVILSYFCFMFGNSLISLTNLDEVFYAQTAKEMIKFNSWMTPYAFGQPQFEKPILFYWLLKSVFMVFGVNSFVSRFFPALFGMIGVVAVYFLGFWGFKDKDKAFTSAVILMTSTLYLVLARTVFADLIFSVFILLALSSFYMGYSDKERKGPGILCFFFFAGLAVLTKGPLGLLIPLATVALFLFLRKEINFLFSRYILWGLLLFSLTALPWYFLMFKLYGNAFSGEFFYNDHFRRFFEAEHIGNDTWYFYLFSIIGGIFPWSLFLICALFLLPKWLSQKTNPFYAFLASWVFVTLAIFQSAHSKSVSYILPLLPAAALITGGFIAGEFENDKLSRLFVFASWSSVFVVLLIPAFLSLILAGYSEFLGLYLPIKAVAYLFIPVFLCLGIAAFIFVLSQKKRMSFYCFALVLPLFLVIVPFASRNIEPYLSAQSSCRYLLDNFEVNNTLLVSKPFLRGVKYYTDKEVAVIDILGKPFFSARPILFLDTDESTRGFLRAQGTTYCLLKKSSLEDMLGLIRDEFTYSILGIKGNVYIVRVSPAAQPGSKNK
ncbi:MAG: glycosyltransferase family 39 protein [Candidatus Omnitrophota bacterium]